MNAWIDKLLTLVPACQHINGISTELSKLSATDCQVAKFRPGHGTSSRQPAKRSKVHSHRAPKPKCVAGISARHLEAWVVVERHILDLGSDRNHRPPPTDPNIPIQLTSDKSKYDKLRRSVEKHNARFGGQGQARHVQESFIP